MAERKKIDPALNRARVKKTMEERDRINVILPKGTADRIDALGVKRSEFAKKINPVRAGQAGKRKVRKGKSSKDRDGSKDYYYQLYGQRK